MLAKTNGIAYFFSLACIAGTTNRQICHSSTGRARMIPPYIDTDRRVVRPSSGPRLYSWAVVLPPQKPTGLLWHRSLYGWSRKLSTWS